ncbi:MAG: trypsin-like peptidase domain-containing protein [Coriobacteriaceae bacterium]|nr:trypsin-like peptidase domain-containing protein [Coriobacteriaceae bacterium]
MADKDNAPVPPEGAPEPPEGAPNWVRVTPEEDKEPDKTASKKKDETSDDAKASESAASKKKVDADSGAKTTRPARTSADQTKKQPAATKDETQKNAADGAWTAPDKEARATADETSIKTGKKNGGGKGGVRGFIGGIIGAVVVAAVIGCLWMFTPVLDEFKSTRTVSNGTIEITGNDEATLAEAVSAKCLDSCVTIYNYSSTSDDWSQYFGMDGSSGSSSDTPDSLGSGVIVKDDGNDCYIVTNNHVVSDAQRVTVTVGEDSYEASPVGYDAKTDLAVLKIDASNMTVMEWGDSSDISVGEWVMALGSPYGYEQTVTTGIVSALYRSDVLADETGTTVYTDMIQTDAAINPGNSGGALVNSRGQLIGINTYISSSSGSYAGLGFAIPSNEVQEVAEALIENGSINHAYLGVTSTSSTDPEGAEIYNVYVGTAAEAAGFKGGDVITKFGDTTITSSSDLTAAVLAAKPGDKFTVTYIRDGQEATTEVTLGDDSNQGDEITADSLENQENSNSGDSSGNGNSGNNGNDNSGNNGNGNSGDNGNGYGYGDNGYGYGYGDDGYGYDYGDSGDSGNGYGFNFGDLFGWFGNQGNNNGSGGSDSGSNGGFWD